MILTGEFRQSFSELKASLYDRISNSNCNETYSFTSMIVAGFECSDLCDPNRSSKSYVQHALSSKLTANYVSPGTVYNNSISFESHKIVDVRTYCESKWVGKPTV